MAVFALADLHLSFSAPFAAAPGEEAQVYKPMDRFGENWRAHDRQIYAHWQERVGERDTVLLPGDISWAMNLAEASFDLDFLAKLPGRKILSRGNHDYWWQGPRKVRAALPGNMEMIQNDCIRLRDWAICGSRGWLNPQNKEFEAADEKIYLRELARLELSLQAGGKKRFADHLPAALSAFWRPRRAERFFGADGSLRGEKMRFRAFSRPRSAQFAGTGAIGALFGERRSGRLCSAIAGRRGNAVSRDFCRLSEIR